MRAAFAGYLGREMKAKARQWAKETPNIKALPERVKKRKKKRKSWVERYHETRGRM